MKKVSSQLLHENGHDPSPEEIAEQAMMRAQAIRAQEKSEQAETKQPEALTEEQASAADAVAETVEEMPAEETEPVAEEPSDTEVTEEEMAASEPVSENMGTADIPEEIEKLAHSIFGTDQLTEPAEEKAPAETEQAPEAEESDASLEPAEEASEPDEETLPEVSSEIQDLADSLFTDMQESAQDQNSADEAPVPVIFGETPDSLESGDLHDLSNMEPIAGSGVTPEMIGSTEEESLEQSDSKELSAIDGAEETIVVEAADSEQSADDAEAGNDTAEKEDPAVAEDSAASEEGDDAETETAETVAADIQAEPVSEETAAEEPESVDSEAVLIEEAADDSVTDVAELEISEASEEEETESAEPIPDIHGSETPESNDLPVEEEAGNEEETADSDLDAPSGQAEEIITDSDVDMLILPAHTDSAEDISDAAEEAVTEEKESDEEEMPGLPEIPMPELSETEVEPDEDSEDTDEAEEEMPGLPELPLPEETSDDDVDSETDQYDADDDSDDDIDLESEQDDEPDAAMLIEKMQLADALGITLDDSDIVQIMTEEPPEWPVHVEDFGSRIEPGMLPESELAGQPPIPEDGKFTAKECRMRFRGEPEFRIPHGFTEIRAGACAAMDDLERLIVPDTVTRIGSGAFADSLSLTEVRLPATLEEIAEDAFEGCESLMRVTMPRSLEATAAKMFGPQTHVIWLETEKPAIIGDGRFTAKIRAKVYEDGDTLTVPEGYTEIRAGACAGLEDLKQVILPNTLVKICSGAFADCTGLIEITIPSGVTELDADAFEGCTAISRVIVSPQLSDAAKECFPNAAVLIRN